MSGETVWLSLDQMADLFQRDKSTISRHIKNVFGEGELDRNSVVAKFATTAADGKTYQVDYYNLDVIISVGYRVKSLRGTQFRIWANSVLKEYLIKGFAMNDELLKKADSQGFIPEVEEIFFHFENPQKILETPDEQLYEEMRKNSLTSRSTEAQIPAWKKNITLLQKWEHAYGSVDHYYQQYIDRDKKRKGLVAPGISLIKTLSIPAKDNPNKLKQMDVALVCEYLKNAVSYTHLGQRQKLQDKTGRVNFSAAFISRRAGAAPSMRAVFELNYETGSRCV